MCLVRMVFLAASGSRSGHWQQAGACVGTLHHSIAALLLPVSDECSQATYTLSCQQIVTSCDCQKLCRCISVRYHTSSAVWIRKNCFHFILIQFCILTLHGRSCVASVYGADGEDTSGQWLLDKLLAPAGPLHLSSGTYLYSSLCLLCSLHKDMRNFHRTVQKFTQNC